MSSTSSKLDEPAAEAARGKRIVLIGPPGGGKGARSADLGELGLVHVASGIALRARVREAPESEPARKALSYMRRGALVPDEIVVPIVLEYIGRPECRERGFVLDGFPRNRIQCDTLLAKIDLDLVLLLEVPREFLFFGVIGCNRRSCVACGAGFSDFDPPREEGRCGNCGGALERRLDDTEETIAERLALYEDSTRTFLPELRRGPRFARMPITVDEDEEVDEGLLLKLKGEIYFVKEGHRRLRMLNREGMRKRLYALLAGLLG